jgi:hypothetical protein
VRTSDFSMTKRLLDILAVSVDDLDAVSVRVVGGVAYIEGLVSSDQQRQLISRLAERTPGIRKVVTRLATENVRVSPARLWNALAVPPPVLMHYYTLGQSERG